MPLINPKLIGFLNSGKHKQFSSGEIVLRGEDPTGVIYIQSGFVRVFSISDEGDRYIHIIYKKGEIFPLIWAINDIRRRIFYEAVSKVEVTEVTKEGFLEFIRKDPDVIYDVLKQLANQFYIFADRLDNLQYKSAHERVAYRIMFLASRFGERKGNSIIIDAPITHTLVGESINLARETISREIEKLEKRGIISYHDSRLVVNDIDKLSKEFSEPVTFNLWGLRQE